MRGMQNSAHFLWSLLSRWSLQNLILVLTGPYLALVEVPGNHVSVMFHQERERKIAPFQCQHQILLYNSWKFHMFSSNQLVKLPETDAITGSLLCHCIMYFEQDHFAVLSRSTGNMSCCSPMHALHLQQSPCAARSLVMTILEFHMWTICLSFVWKQMAKLI